MADDFLGKFISNPKAEQLLRVFVFNSRDAFTFRLKAPDQDTARTMLERLDLSGVMERITCPLLVIMGRQDRLVPPEAAEQMVREAGAVAELWMFEDGNHVCNNIPYKYRPRQADWMRTKLFR